MNNYFSKVFLTHFFFLSILLSLTTISYGSNVSCISTKWPYELSDIQPDPSLLRGQLDNGFRYIIKKNSEPENRVAIYLKIGAGSLYETEEQRGVAHFLEHLMFNGSKNFPPGSLVEYFQSIGMNFGGDTNAYTAYDKTVYHIILPDGSQQELSNGFLVMADYARGALLLDSEIDREREVILAEKMARDSKGYRTRVASSTFAFRGTRYPDRSPIGIEKTLKEADHDTLKSYYDTWYRPDNMVLVVVGEIEPSTVEPLIEESFAKLEPARVAPECPEFGNLSHKGIEAFYLHEPELGKTNVSIETFWDLPLENDSISLERRELIRIIGSLVLNYRLQEMQEAKNQPFTTARYSSGDIIDRIGYGSLSAQTNKKDWRLSLSTLDKSLRRALQHGFGESEIERVKKEILAALDNNALTADSQHSRTIARIIIDHLSSNRVYQSAIQEKDLYEPMLRYINVEEINSMFRTVWDHNSRLISVTGDTYLGSGGTELVKQVYEESLQQNVEAPKRKNNKKFPYLTTVSPDGKQASQLKYFKDIDVEKLVFRNGLLVNLKKTDFVKNRFQLVLNFGGGEQGEQIPGQTLLAEEVVNRSGSGQLSQTELAAQVAGSSIGMSFTIGESAFSWAGGGLFKDFELFIQVLHTLIFDPGLRKNAFETARNRFELMYQRLEYGIEGGVPLAVQPFLAGYSSHFGLPPWSTVEKIRFEDLATWLTPLMQAKDMEISVVGDYNRDEVVQVLDKYFGTIKLSPPRIPKASSVVFPEGQKLEVEVESSVEKSHITVAWPTDDFWDIKQTRRLHILAEILGDRLRKIIREKLGASYSPSVSSFGSRVYHDYGYISAQMIVSPGSEDAVIKEILQITDQLKNEGITGDELSRAQNPLITSLKDSTKTNHYWLNSVLSLSSRYPQKLDWPKTIINDFLSITEDEVNDLASRYLNNKKAAIAKVIPTDAKKSANSKALGKN